MDLGIKDSPLLIFGGPYSNLQALRALQDFADSNSFSPENIICTGDVVAYCAQPYETTEAIRDWGIHTIMGNCEESFANNTNDCGCGFEEGTQCDLLSNQWFSHANKLLTQSQREWFASLPRAINFQLGNKLCRVVHGSVASINQFLFNSSPIDIYEKQFSLSQADILIAGHSGIPFTRIINNKIWHNSGALGMPANDGTPRTWFSIITQDNNNLKIKHRSLEYDFQKAQQKMLQAGLTSGYDTALASGLWPSLDVLPKIEKEQAGVPLKEIEITSP